MPTWYSSRLRAKAGRWLRHNREEKRRDTDMLDLNLPKNSYVFLCKHLEEGIYQVPAVFASDVLKRNTDSLRCAVENDVFDSLPQDSLLNELEMGD